MTAERARHRLYDAKKRGGWCFRMGRNGQFFSEWRGRAVFKGGLVLTGAARYP